MSIHALHSCIKPGSPPNIRGSTRNVDSGIWQDRLQQPWDDSEISHESPTGLTPRGGYTILYKKLEQYVIHCNPQNGEMMGNAINLRSEFLWKITNMFFGFLWPTFDPHGFEAMALPGHSIASSLPPSIACWPSGTLRFAPDKSYNWRKKKKIDKNRL